MSSQFAFDVSHWTRPGVLQLHSLPPLSLYVHLPWCLKKCPYCDFNSHVWSGEEGVLPAQRYVLALLNDLELSLPLIWGRPIHSMFIGGGTPSLFEPQVLEQLISGIRARVPLLPNCEITLEANPGTFEKNRFREFRLAGVNRLSIGVQTFQDQYLSILGRVHNAAQAIEAAHEATECFEQWNIDLMYGLPSQGRSELLQDLTMLRELNPPHVSIYQLTIEANTQFAKFPPKQLPDQDLAYDMLDDILDFSCRVGLNRYEVSAFAKPGMNCRHNTNYWQFGDYLGIGAGAHSKISFAHRILRSIRWRDPNLYLQNAMHSPVAQVSEVKRLDLPFEFMLNALRLVDGFPLSWFPERTGMPMSSIEKALEKAIAKNWLQLEEDWLKPTALGMNFLSDVQQLFLD